MILKEVFVRQKAHNFDSLDGLRALSILLVIGFHAFFLVQYAFEEREQFAQFAASIPAWLVWLKRGDLGVDIFFVLSAFLLSTQLFKELKTSETLNVKWFYARRFLRIYPLYIAILLLYMAGKGFTPHVFGNLLAYNNVINLKETVIPWTWSLTVEIQFYLIAPWLIYFLTSFKRLLFVVLASVVLSVVWMSYFLLTHPVLANQSVLDVMVANDKATILYYLQFLYVVPPARVGSFVVGVALAWLLVHKKHQAGKVFASKRGRALVVIALLVALFVASSDVYLPVEAYSSIGYGIYKINFISGRLVFSIAIGVVLLATVTQERHWLKTLLSSPVWYPVARVSYSMYLFHPFMLFLSYFVLFGEEKITELSMLGLLGLFVLGSLFSFIVGVITYYAIERWFISERFHRKAKRYFFVR